MQSFYFYDLETSGFKPREARIMQFGGQRTDMDLKPIGKPHNLLIKMSDDVLPDPSSILLTGISPQQTVQDGLTEAEFLKLFTEEIATPDSIFVGFNNVRFDDEFIRFLHYRNFYDPYEWQWQSGRSRWDLLDVVRMTRALRPDGIKWPNDENGDSTNRLTELTKINKLDHASAHDALNDVLASISLARLIKEKQPKLFDFLLQVHDKKNVANLADTPQPFVYTSGKYPSEFEKTTVAVRLADHPKNRGLLVYDLRHDPTPFLAMSPTKLAEAWQYKPREDTSLRVPVKTLQFNRCPAVAPLAVLDLLAIKRLKLNMIEVKNNIKKLKQSQGFVERLYEALEIMDKKIEQTPDPDVDTKLYDGFFENADKTAMRMVRAAEGDELNKLSVKFTDRRLEALMPLYKARNFPKLLSGEERELWEAHRVKKLLGGGENSAMQNYFMNLTELAKRPNLSKQESFLLQELQLWGEAILPEPLA